MLFATKKVTINGMTFTYRDPNSWSYKEYLDFMRESAPKSGPSDFYSLMLDIGVKTLVKSIVEPQLSESDAASLPFSVASTLYELVIPHVVATEKKGMAV